MELLTFVKDYWAILIFLGTMFAWILKYIKALQDGIKAILHDRIIQKCEFLINRGYVTSDDLEELEYLNGPYKALGGNGTVEVMLREVRKLPKKK